MNEENLPPCRRKILVMELWGLGDLTFSTPVLREASSHGNEVFLLAKPYAKEFLQPSLPELHFIHYQAPWTAYRGKYALWKWNWPELLALIWRLRRERFDIAVSVRNDPRDHLFMWLIGARDRYGYPCRGSQVFLNHPLQRNQPKQHRVEDWREVGAATGMCNMERANPALEHGTYFSESVNGFFAGLQKPVICLHTGARISVRRWPKEYFVEIVQQLRSRYDFHLLLIPDPDGYGADFAPLADTFLPKLSVRELVDTLGRCDLLLCNDSGPAHIAACCGRPVISIFGPSDPDWFRPWGEAHKVVIRDICPWRPCFDYCKFNEPHCLTKLLPETVWPEIREHVDALVARGVISLQRPEEESAFANA